MDGGAENVIATLEADAARVGADLEALASEEGALADDLVGLEVARGELAAATAAFEDQWGTPEEDAETALALRAERVALVERSLSTLREAERRATSRLDSATEARTAAETRRRELIDERAAADEMLATARAERDDATTLATSSDVAATQAEDAWREAADRAARTQARADALARALEELSGAGGRAILKGLDGVLGAFLDLVEVDVGAEGAVESAAGAAAGAMVVDGRRQTRAALEALRRGGGAGLILPVAEGDFETPVAPAGTVALRSLVRARRGAPEHVTRVLDVLFSRAVVAESFEAGIDVAVANPDLVVVTREGDRFASSGWRVGSGQALVTRSTVDEAMATAADAASSAESLRAAHNDAARAARAARERLVAAGTAVAAVEARATAIAVEAHRVADALGVAGADVELLGREVQDVAAQCATLDDELASLRAGVAELEAAAGSMVERRARGLAARAELDDLRARVAERGAAWSRREAQVAERRSLLEGRRAEIEDRLEGRNVERDEAARRRESIEFDLAALARLETMVRRARRGHPTIPGRNGLVVSRAARGVARRRRAPRGDPSRASRDRGATRRRGRRDARPRDRARRARGDDRQPARRGAP